MLSRLICVTNLPESQEIHITLTGFPHISTLKVEMSQTVPRSSVLIAWIYRPYERVLFILGLPDKMFSR
jgi:hypothetical protein